MVLEAQAILNFSESTKIGRGRRGTFPLAGDPILTTRSARDFVLDMANFGPMEWDCHDNNYSKYVSLPAKKGLAGHLESALKGFLFIPIPSIVLLKDVKYLLNSLLPSVANMGQHFELGLADDFVLNGDSECKV